MSTSSGGKSNVVFLSLSFFFPLLKTFLHHVISHQFGEKAIGMCHLLCCVALQHPESPGDRRGA